MSADDVDAGCVDTGSSVEDVIVKEQKAGD